MNIKIIYFIVLALLIFLVRKAPAFEFIIRGSANEMYDDNINTSATSPESDWVTNLILGMGIESAGRRRVINLSGNIYQRFYVEHEEYNKNFQDMNLSIKLDFTERFNLIISDSFEHYPQSQSFGTLFGRKENNEGYISNYFSGNMSFLITRQLLFSLFYNNSMVDNDSSALTDSVLHNPGGYIGYSFDTANILRAGYSYSYMKYDDGDITRGDRSYAEYERYLTKQLRAILHGGYDYYDTTEGESSSSRWLISLIDDFDKQNQFNLTYLKETTISNISNDTLNNWRITGTLQRVINARTNISTGLFYGVGTYKVSREIEKLAGVSFTLAYIVTNFVKFNMGYTYTWNSFSAPDVKERSYNRNQVYAGISAVY